MADKYINPQLNLRTPAVTLEKATIISELLDITRTELINTAIEEYCSKFDITKLKEEKIAKLEQQISDIKVHKIAKLEQKISELNKEIESL